MVGVFGVPAVHEYDAERAVRAGLRLLETLEDMTRPDNSPLQARVGINTGEALVRLDQAYSDGRRARGVSSRIMMTGRESTGSGRGSRAMGQGHRTSAPKMAGTTSALLRGAVTDIAELPRRMP